MDEYISREAANKWLSEMFISLDHVDEGCKELIDRFNKGIPAADVVEVVRCRDCKRADEYGHCEMQTFWGTRDDFCSRGERKDNG